MQQLEDIIACSCLSTPTCQITCALHCNFIAGQHQRLNEGTVAQVKPLPYLINLQQQTFSTRDHTLPQWLKLGNCAHACAYRCTDLECYTPSPRAASLESGVYQQNSKHPQRQPSIQYMAAPLVLLGGAFLLLLHAPAAIENVHMQGPWNASNMQGLWNASNTPPK